MLAIDERKLHAMKFFNVLALFLLISFSSIEFACKNKDKTTTEEKKTDAPVVVSSDDQLRTNVNTVLAAYPTATAEIKDGVVTLKGTIKRDDLQTLMSKVQELRPKKVENQLIIQ